MAKTRKSSSREKHKNHISQKPHSWAAVISLFTCKYLQVQQVQRKVQHPKQKQKQEHRADSNTQRNKKEEAANKMKMKCSGSLCSNTKVMQKPELIISSSSSSSSPEEDNNNKKKRASNSLTASRSHDCNNRRVSNRSTKTNNATLTSNYNSRSSSSSSSTSFFTTTSLAAASPSKSGSSLRSKHFRRFSGCYECKMVVDPVLAMTRDPSLRNSVRSCAECGEIFMKAENLELHQIVKHAVSELGPEDTSRNIVEIIFQSSWLKRQTPVCRIDRILKVQNTPQTISRFEEYRDTIKSKATKKHPRCLADGNELLRFHCTTLMCPLGLNGSSNLCDSIPNCGVCSVIKNGFRLPSEISSRGILTTATSGKAHDSARLALGDGRRAMLVCRVIAGRVKKSPFEGNVDDYDSVGGSVYSNLDELYVSNPKAILPCFVVIYRGF